MSKLPTAVGGVIAGFILVQLAGLLRRQLIRRWVHVPAPVSAAATPTEPWTGGGCDL